MKKIGLVVLFFVAFWTEALVAQDNSFREIDDRPWHYGFVLGFNVFNFSVTPTNIKQFQGAQVSSVTPGFTVGLILDKRLSKYFDLRTVPTLNLLDRVVTYQDSSLRVNKSIPATIDFKSSLIDIPVYLKYRAVWYGHSRPYVLLGGGMTYSLSHDGVDGDGNTQVSLKPVDFYIAAGVGCDFYFKYFRLAPELKFTFGLNNLLNSTPPSGANPLYTNELSKMTSRAVVLSFNFE